MVKFYREYSSEDFLGLLKRYSDHVAPVGQLASSAIVQPAAGQIPDVLQKSLDEFVDFSFKS